MDCTISPQNALAIDRILRVVKTHSISIDTTAKILFQLVSSDRTLVLNLSFEETFFSDLHLKKRLVTMPKQRFYMKKMKSLRIVCAEYTATFEYLFETHVLRRNVFYSTPSLFSVSFSSVCSGEALPSVLADAFGEISGHSIAFTASGDLGEISTKGTSIRFPMKLTGEFSVNTVGGNLKSIFEASSLFLQAIVNYEAQNSPLNIILVGTELRASFFTAVNDG